VVPEGSKPTLLRSCPEIAPEDAAPDDVPPEDVPDDDDEVEDDEDDDEDELDDVVFLESEGSPQPVMPMTITAASIKNFDEVSASRILGARMPMEDIIRLLLFQC
jgi:hypothetical protein